MSPTFSSLSLPPSLSPAIPVSVFPTQPLSTGRGGAEGVEEEDEGGEREGGQTGSSPPPSTEQGELLQVDVLVLLATGPSSGSVFFG